MVTLNSHGEVADFIDVNQFIPSHSAYECVAYAAALIKYCGQPGHGATGTALQASNLAQYWYGKEEGSNLASNTNGMSLDAEYNMLSGIGLHYHASSPTIEYVKAWLEVGYPLMICGAETGMYDVGLGDHIPYTWTPSGNHCIVASGIASDGNLLVHDTANIAPTGVRTGPRVYDVSKLNLVSATAIAVPWLPALPTDYDPVKEKLSMGGIPSNWHDDGTTLTAPNGVKVVHGFRDYVLSHNWDSANEPLASEYATAQLEDSNTALGNGTQQVFRLSMLGWTASRGVFEEWLGVELSFARGQVAKYYALIQQLQQQVTALQAPTNPTLLSDMQQIKAIATKY